MEPLAPPEDGRAELGVLFVHGIGEQAQGQTLAQCTEPLLDWWRDGGGAGLAGGIVTAESSAAALLRNAALKPKSTLQSATGIQAPVLRQVSMGMTGGSFNTREFFHHASAATLPRLKWAFQGLLFLLPALSLGALFAGAPAGLWWLALASQVPGVLAERWLFFAQARHPQNLYYQVVS